MSDPEEMDVAGFAVAFRQLMEEVHRLAPSEESILRARALAHLGVDPDTLPSLSERLDQADLPNVQLAVDAVLADAPGWELIGLPAEVRHYGGFSLSALLSGRMGFAQGTSAASYVNVPIGVDETLPCVELGLYLFTFEALPVALLVGTVEDRGPQSGITLEVVSTDRDVASRLLRRLRELMLEHNVYRGKVLAFTFSEWGRFGITFQQVPALTREDLILPEADLAAIEQHTVVLSEHAEELRAAGRHLRRGLLLFGPPGTGKTLSITYLCNAMPGRTTVILSGTSAGAIGQAVAIARTLQPSTVVIEDVDLVAMERTMPGMGSNPMLFQLLNEMDGLAEDADALFVLTTNRVDLLEPALASRPGRVDQAVEIGLPDDDARGRLLALYLRGVDHTVAPGDGFDRVIERTEGVSAAFIKELVRRSVLRVAGEARSLTVEDVDESLTDLLERSAPVLRSTLGANPEVAGAFEGIQPGFASFGDVQGVIWTED